MKLKRFFRGWTSREKRETLAQIRMDSAWLKNARLALKFAKKSLRHICKDAEDECGFWYDVNDGFGYAECCKLRGRGGCDYKGKDCPLELARRLVESLTYCK